MIKTAEAPAEICSASGMMPSEFIFQICTAKVSAGLNKFRGLDASNGFHFVKSTLVALCPAV